ncbi:MAG: hypothetical protein JWO02_682 [Solirubrobacterales bacterium]|nr:hypothetical protein [Solirubrobacterales bacterium]
MSIPETLSVTPPVPRSTTHPFAVALVLAMALGSVVLWIGIPAAWIFLAAQVSETSKPTLAPLLMIFFGAPLTMLPTAKVLSALDRRHRRLIGVQDDGRKPAPWYESMRDAEHTGPRSVLAVVMVISVALAFVALAIWFFFFAGSSLPS